jgi:hypothetical protein
MKPAIKAKIVMSAGKLPSVIAIIDDILFLPTHVLQTSPLNLLFSKNHAIAHFHQFLRSMSMAIKIMLHCA